MCRSLQNRFPCLAVIFVSSKNTHLPKPNDPPRCDRAVGGGVFVCARACIPQSTQKTHCWLAPKQHSRLFPTDKEALVSHSETGPIHCPWLQKTGNRSHSPGVQFTEQTAETSSASFSCRKPEEKFPELVMNNRRASCTLNINLDYTLTLASPTYWRGAGAPTGNINHHVRPAEKAVTNIRANDQASLINWS